MSTRGVEPDGTVKPENGEEGSLGPTILDVHGGEQIQVSDTPEVIIQNVISVAEGGQRAGVQAVPSGIYPDAFGINLEKYLDIRISKRTSTYLPVTEAEIEAYAQLGSFESIFLTILGILWGFALGCMVALIQGNLTDASKASLISLSITTGVVGLIFLILAVIMIILKRKSKKAWESND